MTTIVAAIAVFLIAVLALGVGNFFGRPPLRGSCEPDCVCSPEDRAACRRVS